MGTRALFSRGIIPPIFYGGGAILPFNPATLSKLTAWYDFTDTSTVSASTITDKTTNGNNATRIAGLTYDTNNALAGGRPALVWPATGSGFGLDLPGLTIQEIIMVTVYDDGIDATFDTFAPIISGFSGGSGSPRILGSSGTGQWTGSSVIVGNANIEGELTNTGARLFKTSALPMPLSVLNFRFPTALTETDWRWGVDSSTASRVWNGPQCEVLLFNATLTQAERAQVYSYLNAKYSKNIPLPSRAVNDLGKIIDKPVGMPTAGPYYPTIINMTDVANFPFDWALYFSTDHDATTGGIWMYVANGDPTVAANWKSYDQAVTDGDFNYLSSKPSANPIYVDTVVGGQTETPRCRVISGQVIMTYQQDGQPNGQATLRAKSTDGVNFTRDGIVAQYPVVGGSSGPGGDHTGYFCWGPNIFPDVPYSWVAYSLGSDGVSGYIAQWGTNDPVNGQWTLIAVMQKNRGRALGVLNSGWIYKWTQAAPESLRDLGNGVYGMICTIGEASAGAGIVSNRIYEVYLDSTGRNPVRQPRLLVDVGASGTFNDNYVAQPSVVDYNGKQVIVYGGNDGATHAVGVAVNEAYVPPNTIPLSPAIPTTGLTTLEVDLSNVGALPSWLEFVKVGTTTPTEAFTATGLQLTVTTGATNGQSFIYMKDGILPSGVSYIEVAFDKVRTIGNTARILNFGLANSKNVIASVTDAIYANNVSSGGSTGATLRRRSRVASVDTVSDLQYDLGNNSNDAKGMKYIGFRWFVSTNQFYFFGESGGEFTASFAPSLSTAALVYPFIGLTASGTTTTEEVKTIRITYG